MSLSDFEIQDNNFTSFLTGLSKSINTLMVANLEFSIMLMMPVLEIYEFMVRHYILTSFLLICMLIVLYKNVYKNQGRLYLYFPPFVPIKIRLRGFQKVYLGSSFVGYYRQGDSEKLLVYFHGNATNANTSILTVCDSVGDCSILIPEYPGYDPGDPFLCFGAKITKKLILDRMRDIFTGELRSGAARDEIVNLTHREVTLWGNSLGAAVALHSYNDVPNVVTRLILQNPFSRIVDFLYWSRTLGPFLRFLVTERWDNVQVSSDVDCPAYIIASEDDRAIPMWQKRSVADNVSETVMVKVPGGHNDEMEGEIIKNILGDFT